MPSNGRGPMTGGRVRGWIRGRLSRKRLTVVGTLAVLAVGVVVVVRALDADAVVAAAGAADPTLRRRPRRLRPFVASPWAPVRRCARGHGPPLPDRIPHCDRIRQSDREPDRPRAGRRRGPRVPAQGPARRAVPDRRRLARCRARVRPRGDRRPGGVALAFLLLTGRSPGSGDSVGTVAPSTALAAAAGIAAVAATVSVATVAVARSDRRFGPALRAQTEHPRLSRAVDAVVRFGSSVRVVAANPRRLGAVFLWSAVVWTLDVLTAVLVLAALTGGIGVFVPTPTLLVVGTLAVSVGNLAKVLPLAGRDRAVRGGVHRTCCEHDWPPRRDGARGGDSRSRAEKRGHARGRWGSPRSRSDSPDGRPCKRRRPQTGSRLRRRGSERGRRERVVEFRPPDF